MLPGPSSSTANVANRAFILESSTNSPDSSITAILSPSPSKATPMVLFFLHNSANVPRLAGLGSAKRPGKWPSMCELIVVT